MSELSNQIRSCSTYTYTTTGNKIAVNTGKEAADYIEQLEARLVIDTLNPNRRHHITKLAGRIEQLEAEVKYLKLEAVETDAECDAMTDKVDQLKDELKASEARNA
jgi:predicted RNase H-like nuclease (RuvC/YqgF family)